MLAPLREISRRILESVGILPVVSPRPVFAQVAGECGEEITWLSLLLLRFRLRSVALSIA